MVKLTVIEYQEGCGYNCQTVTEHGSWWASRRPFNRVEMQRRIDRFCLDNPEGVVEQQMIYSQEFAVPNNACSRLVESSAPQRESTLKKLSARRVLSQPATNR